MSTPTPTLIEAWRKFQANLDKARLMVEDTPRFKDCPQHRAEAYNVLFQAQAYAYNWIIAPRLNHPSIYTNRVFMPGHYCPVKLNHEPL